MGSVGPMELLVILLILLLLFGANRLAGLGAAVGKTVKEFRKAISDVETEIKDVEEPRKPNSSSHS